MDYHRAEYTLDVLKLNDREYLVQAREIAFEFFASRLFEYLQTREAGASKKTLDRFRWSIRRHPHQTVWAEMKRQHASLPRIRSRFIEAPEVLKW